MKLMAPLYTSTHYSPMANRPAYKIFHPENDYLRPVGAMREDTTEKGDSKLSLQLDVLPVNFSGRLIALESKEEEKQKAA